MRERPHRDRRSYWEEVGFSGVALCQVAAAVMPRWSGQGVVWILHIALDGLRFRYGHAEVAAAPDRGFGDLDEWREEQHVRRLSVLLRCLGKTGENVATDPKGRAWKIAIAAEMKCRTNVTNTWFALKLNIGSPSD